jgi:hypothetical protein
MLSTVSPRLFRGMKWQGMASSRASGGDEVGKQALVASMGPGRVVEVKATGRVLEHRSCFPWRAHAAAIPALFQKAEFEFQDFEDVAFVGRHWGPLLGRVPMTADSPPDKSIVAAPTNVVL